MRRDQLLAFDEIISSGATAYTPATLNQRLAAHEQIGIQVVIDNVAGTPSFDLWIEHSPDGRTWLPYAEIAQSFPPSMSVGAGDISFSSGSLGTNATYSRMYSAAALGVNRMNVAGAPGPLLSNVRLSMKLGTGEAHVKAYVVLRNP
jgi:hypothetical protein